MADTLARMRQLIGTTADWAANDIVIGLGELALESVGGSVVKTKIGDGVKHFSALPYDVGTWDALTGKPTTFPPAPHTHPTSDIIGLLDPRTVTVRLVVRGANTAIATAMNNGKTADNRTMVTGDLLLVLDQGAANGIYQVPATGAATRQVAFDTWAELVASGVLVSDGDQYGGASFKCTSILGGTLGTTPVVYARTWPVEQNPLDTIVTAFANEWSYTLASGVQPTEIDALGYIGAAFDPASGARVEGLATLGDDPYAMCPLDDWTGFHATGQSLVIGINSIPALHTAADSTTANLTFAGGPTAGTPGNNYSNVNITPGTSATVALIENENPSYSAGEIRGETIGYTWANEFSKLLGQRKGLDPKSKAIFTHNSGHGGFQAASFLKPGAPWYGFRDQLFWLQSHAATAGKQASMRLTVWWQGVTDVVNLTPRATYKTTMLQVMQDMREQNRLTAMAFRRQFRPFDMLVIQCSHGVITWNDVPLAQMDAIDADVNIHFLMPDWIVPKVSDGTHATNWGEVLAGGYAARASYELLVERLQEPRYLKPAKSALLRAGVVRLNFTVPKLPLVLTGPGGVTTQFGLSAKDAAGTDMPFSAVAVDGSSVLCTLTNPAAVPTRLRCALDFKGAAITVAAMNGTTNLCDSSAETVMINGVATALPHIAPAFEVPIYPG